MNTARVTEWHGRQERSRLAKVERLGSLIGGGVLAAWGIRRLVDHRTPGSIGMTAAGGLLLTNGIRGRSAGRRGVHMETSFSINKPADELFRFWRNLENLPKFMKHLETVQSTGGRRSHWVARGPMGANFSWDAEITDEKENEWIVWRSLPGSPITTSGSVHFRKAPGERGTVLTVAVDYQPMGGSAGPFLANLLGAVPKRQLREEVRHFKQLTEAGEIPTIDGQPSGRRSAVISMIQKAARQARPQMAGLRTA